LRIKNNIYAVKEMINGIGKILYVSLEEILDRKVFIANGKKQIKTKLNNIPEYKDKQ
jgi:hypothetical protein